MRLFLAVLLPAHIKDRIAEISKDLPQNKSIKKVKKENLHITIKFIGEAEPQTVIEEVKKVKLEKTRCKVEGVGAFPNERYVRVIWCGAKGLEEWAQLFGESNFRGHITIARVKAKTQLKEFFNKYRNIKIGEFEVSSLVLMESTLKREGAEYRIVEEFNV